MDPAAEKLYERVRARLAPEEFERRLREASTQFGGLLDDEACALLVLDELGLNEGAYATLGDLAGRSEATARVRIERIEPPRTFERAGRDPGRVANVVVSDATGETRLVFWDKDVDRIEEGSFRAGAHLTVVNARVKPGKFGAELHVGPWTAIEVEGAMDPAKRKLLADVRDGSADPSWPSQAAGAPEKGDREPVQSKLPMEDLATTLEGALAWRSDTRPYRTKEGATSFVCDADIETTSGMCRLVAWDAHVKSVRTLAEGARVRVSELAPKVRGATTEWHTTLATRIEAL